jgi:hypothetical protein
MFATCVLQLQLARFEGSALLLHVCCRFADAFSAYHPLKKVWVPNAGSRQERTVCVACTCSWAASVLQQGCVSAAVYVYVFFLLFLAASVVWGHHAIVTTASTVLRVAVTMV